LAGKHQKGVDFVQGVTLNGKFQTLTRLTEVVRRSRLVQNFPKNFWVENRAAKLGARAAKLVFPPPG
jgi:hypothetical protein